MGSILERHVEPGLDQPTARDRNRAMERRAELRDPGRRGSHVERVVYVHARIHGEAPRLRSRPDRTWLVAQPAHLLLRKLFRPGLHGLPLAARNQR